MGKQFFEVFPKLKLDQKNQDLFEQTEIEKVREQIQNIE